VCESSGKIKTKPKRKCLKNWYDKIKVVIEEKQTVYKRWLHSGIIEDNVEYK
jgi:hypothetical protein